VRLAVVVVLATALAACGSSGPRTVDPASVEAAIRADVVRQGGALKTIKCPAGIKAKPGATFDCTIALDDGSTAVAHVTMATANRFDFTTAKTP
jgi:predicted small lipoprotein YifL